METLREKFKNYSIYIYDSYSNSGATFYGRYTRFGLSFMSAGKRETVFKKQVKDFTDEEFEKYKHLILEEENKQILLLQKRKENEKKLEKYIQDNLHLVKFPITYYSKYDQHSLIEDTFLKEVTTINDLDTFLKDGLRFNIIYGLKNNQTYIAEDIQNTDIT